MMRTRRWEGLRRLWPGTAGPIGVDFDGDRIQFAQVERRGDVLTLREARSIRCVDEKLEELISSKGELRRVVHEMMRGSRFKGRRIVTHAPTAHLRLMVLSYRVEEGASEPEQIVSLARERMRDDLSGHVVDYIPIRTSGEQHGERTALVAIAPEEPVIEHLDRLRRAGFVVEALEIAPVAIRRLFAALANRTQKDVALIVRLRQSTTQLALLSGRRLLLYRDIESGFDRVFEEVSKALEAEVETARDLLASYGVGGAGGELRDSFEFGASPGGEAGEGDITETLRDTVRPALRGIVEQAHKMISYASFQTRGMSLDGVYLMEGSDSCPGLDGLLAEMLQLPVEPFDPMGALAGSPGCAGREGGQRYSLALGMALRGLTDV